MYLDGPTNGTTQKRDPEIFIYGKVAFPTKTVMGTSPVFYISEAKMISITAMATINFRFIITYFRRIIEIQIVI